jgi:L-ascorbate metabolism protein UlaG (beta-lactamase superfamily)
VEVIMQRASDWDMELGFETIGNATLVCHDRGPVLVTDPWIVGPAYFGSWTLGHEIPDAQRDSIMASRYVWFSHGHPDHLSTDSLQRFRGKKILLPDHHGGRIRDYLESEGFDVRVLVDREWYELSPKIRVLSIADCNQDALLLVDLGGVLIVNKNDAIDHGWAHFVRKIVRSYKTSFLLSLSGYGDADMFNFFDEDGRRSPPPIKQGTPPGWAIARMTEFFGAKFFVPFSSMHRYQRRDSIWANEYVMTVADYRKGFDSRTAEILPAFIRYDCAKGTFEEIRPAAVPNRVVEPEEFGDDWSTPLESGDVAMIREYFGTVSHLESVIDFINFRVGERDNLIEIGGRRLKKGITFEVPRHSLLCAVKWKIFDDLLIGNFMKTTLHGPWGKQGLYPDFTPYVAKYADNGLARTPEELEAYFAAYRRRAPLEFLRHRLVEQYLNIVELPTALVRTYVPRDSTVYKWARRTYWAGLKRLGTPGA